LLALITNIQNLYGILEPQSMVFCLYKPLFYDKYKKNGILPLLDLTNGIFWNILECEHKIKIKNRV